MSLYILSLFLLLLQPTAPSFCGAPSLSPPKLTLATTNFSRRNLNTLPYTPIKIAVDYTYMRTQSHPHFEKLKKILDNSTLTLSKILKVQAVPNISINLQNFESDHEVTVYDKKLVTPFIYDFVIYPKFVNDLSPSVIASALHVRQLDVNYRPLTGFININSTIDFSIKNIEHFLGGILLHEITHLLAFSVNLYDYFQGENQRCLKKITINNKIRTLINCTKVVETAKKYFNCSEIEGVELESQGGTGSAGSHWEARVMLGDYMTANSYIETTLSEITLALFEDTGWYQVNYYTGGLQRFGKGKGCNFLTDKCIKNGETAYKNEFIGVRNQYDSICTSGRTGQAVGYFEYKEDVPRDFEYIYNMGSKYILGVENVDYCPIPYAYNTFKIKDEDFIYDHFYQNCNIGTKGYFDQFLYSTGRNGQIFVYSKETYPSTFTNVRSDHSFCALTNTIIDYKDGYDDDMYKVYRGVCLEMFCSSLSLTIKVNGVYAVCPRQGGKIAFKGIEGYLLCPDYNLICTGTKMCNDLYDCINKKSLPKENTFLYNEYESRSTLDQDDAENMPVSNAYELSENGTCIKNCKKCIKILNISYCLECRDDYIRLGYSEYNLSISCIERKMVHEGWYVIKDGVYFNLTEDLFSDSDYRSWNVFGVCLGCHVFIGGVVYILFVCFYRREKVVADGDGSDCQIKVERDNNDEQNFNTNFNTMDKIN